MNEYVTYYVNQHVMVGNYFFDFEGKKYQLVDCVGFAGMKSPYELYNDVPEGEEYSFEMYASAFDNEGEKCILYWAFTDIKDENEKHEEDYNYDIVDRVEYIS